MNQKIYHYLVCTISLTVLLGACNVPDKKGNTSDFLAAKVKLVPAELVVFNSFVDCNMATVWIKDTFRIFPGKYGEDPLWGEAHELRYASGISAKEVFNKKPEEFTEPCLPENAQVGTEGLHGAVWFETLYKDTTDISEQTLFALYHNENYPETLPYDPLSGKGYKDVDWPQGLKGEKTKSAVCRIGIMKSVDGGKSWEDKGIILEDDQPRLILKPHNTGINFAGGNGDPSAAAVNGSLFIFYGEYGYPGVYDSSSYNPVTERSGQCISVAQIVLSDLENPKGKARRWGGNSFNVKPDSIGRPVTSLQIPVEEGGGPASSDKAKYYWGPSVSWNAYLKCWVMLMAKAEGPSWKGNSIYISFNPNHDLGVADHSQQWTKPELLLSKPGHIIWYPALQPYSDEGDGRSSTTGFGQKARLFYKDIVGDQSSYKSDYIIDFGGNE